MYSLSGLGGGNISFLGLIIISGLCMSFCLLGVFSVGKTDESISAIFSLIRAILRELWSLLCFDTFWVVSLLTDGRGWLVTWCGSSVMTGMTLEMTLGRCFVDRGFSSRSSE